MLKEVRASSLIYDTNLLQIISLSRFILKNTEPNTKLVYKENVILNSEFFDAFSRNRLSYK
jgi:hypothetical protein